MGSSKGSGCFSSIVGGGPAEKLVLGDNFMRAYFRCDALCQSCAHLPLLLVITGVSTAGFHSMTALTQAYSCLHARPEAKAWCQAHGQGLVARLMDRVGPGWRCAWHLHTVTL